MNLKKKLRAFFTLARKGDGGFTLVELIVVIAILAILGGVAVPAYSGYVKKAERAADEQLLAAVNKAYASACLMNGTDMVLLDGASMPLTTNKTVDTDNVEPYEDAFKQYYAGNEDAAFKVFSSIVFDTDKHRFVDIGDAGSFSISVNGVTYKANAESVAAYLNSTLGQNLTTGELLDIVNLVTNVLGNGFGDDDLAAALSSQSYKDAVVAALGLPEGTTYEEYIAAQKEAAMQQYYKDNNITNPNRAEQKSASDAANAKIATLEKNLIPLVGASKAEEAGKDIMTILKSETAKDTIVGNVNSTENSAFGISQSTLAYALYQSYAVGAGEEANVLGFLDALEGKDDGKFKAYLDTDQASTDLDGVLGAMNVISNQNPDTLESTATNGFDNEDLENALTQILGK